MLVHAATAPNAVLRTLPALPHELWAPSLSAAWAATAAVTAAYAPAHPDPAAGDGRDAGGRSSADLDPVTLMAYAAGTGDEHAIKFADTAIDAYRRRGDPAVLASASRSVAQISAD